MAYVQGRLFSTFERHADPRFRVCVSPDELQYADNLLSAATIVGADYETSGLRWWAGDRPVGVAFAARAAGTNELLSVYVPYRHTTGQKQACPEHAIALQKKILERPETTKVFHNRKFDDHMARREGIELRGPIVDTMIEAALYREDQPKGLKVRAVTDLGDPEANRFERMLDCELKRLAAQAGFTKSAFLERFGYGAVDIHLVGLYGANDPALTLRLHEFYEEQGLRASLAQSPRGPQFWGLWDIEMHLTKVLTDMEEVGIPLDVEHLHAMHKHLSKERDRAELKFFQRSQLDHFNLGSDAELRERLTGLGVKLTKKTKQGRLAVDAEVLRAVAERRNEWLWVLRWKDVEKKLSTYTLTLLKFCDAQGVLHGNYQQMGTVTGRLSCRNPNFQNQPAGVDTRLLRALDYSDADVSTCERLENVKRVYAVQRPDTPTTVRLFADYSQVELRVLAQYTQDSGLLEAYRRGEDIHGAVERAVFATSGPNRRKAKVINFGLSYCMSAMGFARKIPEVTADEAEQYFQQYNESFPRVPEFRVEFWKAIASHGCAFRSLFGRKRHLPGMLSGDKPTQERAKRMAIATLIQGTAAEFTKQSLVFLDAAFRDLGLKGRLTGTVHDEIQLDVPADELAQSARLTKRVMEDFPDFAIPIRVDVEYSTTSWADKQALPGL